MFQTFRRCRGVTLFLWLQGTRGRLVWVLEKHCQRTGNRKYLILAEDTIQNFAGELDGRTRLAIASLKAED